MTSEIAFVVAAICYGISTAVGIGLRDGRVVPTAAALAPTAAALGIAAGLPWPVTIAAPIAVALMAQLLSRSRLGPSASHVILYSAGAACFVSLGDVISVDRTVALATAVGVTLLYSFGEAVRQRAWRNMHIGGSSDLRTWLLLQAVLVSASGLTILVLDELGAIPVVAMLIVLILTKREFEDLARSRVALDQTVRSLDRLSELAARD